MKQKLATISVALLIVLSGCAATQGPLTFSSDPATVTQAGLDNTGYELQNQEQYTINRTVEVQNQSKEVKITNHVTAYTRQSSVKGVSGDATTGMFTVLTTPSASFAGQSLNPLSHVSNERLLNEIGSRSQNINNIQKLGTYNTTILNNQAEVTEFSATTTLNGQQVDIKVHIVKTTHNGDLVVAVGLYPEKLENTEEDAIKTLFKNIQHTEQETTETTTEGN